MPTTITSEQIRNKSLKSEDLSDDIIINDRSSATGSLIVNGVSGLLISASAQVGSVIIAADIPQAELAGAVGPESILLTGSSIELKGNTYVAGELDVFAELLEITGSLSVTGSFFVKGDAFVVDTVADLLEVTGSLSVTGSFSNDGNVFVTGSVFVKGDAFVIDSTTRFGGELQIITGSNKPVGKFQLTGIPTVINNALITNESLVFLQKQTATSPGASLDLTVGSGFFSVTSSLGGDTDWVAYLIINPL